MTLRLPRYLLLLLATSSAFLLHAAPTELRRITNFNREWTFQLGDISGAEAAAFDDAKWDDANLPHSFSMPYFAADRFYVGYGWYRKHFDVPAAWTDKRINLEFDGVFQVAEVFVNGQRIGEHKGGYTGFTFDITDAVKTGRQRRGGAREQHLERPARAARRRARFLRRHLSQRAARRHRAAACGLVRHVCHHAAGVEGIRHGEREDGSGERFRHARNPSR